MNTKTELGNGHSGHCGICGFREDIMIDLDKIEKENSVVRVTPCVICDKEINVYPHDNGGIRICGECKSRLKKLLYGDKEEESCVKNIT